MYFPLFLSFEGISTTGQPKLEHGNITKFPYFVFVQCMILNKYKISDKVLLHVASLPRKEYFTKWQYINWNIYRKLIYSRSILIHWKYRITIMLMDKTISWKRYYIKLMAHWWCKTLYDICRNMHEKWELGKRYGFHLVAKEICVHNSSSSRKFKKQNNIFWYFDR